MKAQLFDILGIDQSVADRAGAAKAMWPANLLSQTQGVHTGDDTLSVITNLQGGLTFTNLRTGVDPHASFSKTGEPPYVLGQIAFTADMTVEGAPVTAQPFYLASMPDIGIQLKATDPLHPAKVYFASDGRGFEIIIDKLPVAIFLKEGTATALSNPPLSVGTFDNTQIDSYAYTLNADTAPAEIDVFVRLQLTTSGDVILEPNIPISFGPCRWLGIPAKAVYDVLLIPSPNRRDYFEWPHNDLATFISNPPVKGALGFRSIDIDFTQAPLADLRDRLQNGAVHIDNVQMVMEDVVIPLFGPLGPIPSHGTFGFRRLITDRTDINQAYSFKTAPVQIPLYNSSGQGGNGGTTWTLQINDFFFQTGDLNAVDPSDQPQVQFDATFVYQGSSGPPVGAQVGIDADWLVNAGIALDPTTTPVKMTIASTDVGAVGAKFGISITRLAQGMKFTDSFELLADLFVAGQPPAGGSSSGGAFQITSLTGKPLQVILHDLGWKLGNLSLDGLQMPNGMQLIFAKIVHVIIEELGYVEEPNGTPYFSFSGGVALGSSGGQKTTPSGNASDSSSSGFGIRVRRLRFRLNDDGTQPPVKLDGIFLNLSYGPVTVAGFGYISDFVDTGWHVNEWGFGVSVDLKLGIGEFKLSAEFVKGNRENLSDATQHFGYFLAALTLGYLPAGPFAMYDIRALVADNMAPNLDSTFPDGEGMALLKWHQNHDSALNFPANRTLADWLPEDGAFSIGVGCGFSINGAGAAMHISIFIFFSKSQADEGILIVGELYLLKNPKPIAFVAIEYDISSGKFGVMIGVAINLGDFASGNLPSWLANIASLSGSIYVGNQPWTFAIGQLADQTSWLQLKLNWDVWVMVLKVMLGVCVEIVDGGPKGFGVVFQITASASWGIGQFIMFGSFGLIIGTWKTGSDSSGVEFWIQIGFKINLFWVFSFGAEIGMKITYLGKSPWYVTLHAEVKIDTPWFLPDVTFSFDKTWQSPQPFDTSTITQSLSSGTGIDPTQSQAQPLLTPGLSDAKNDPTAVYTFNNLNTLSGVLIADTTQVDVPLVSVDATIAITFTQPLSNDSSIATATYGGTTETGVQTVQDITARYALQSVSIRRAPRFGPTAGQWTDFVTDAQTQFSVGGNAPEYITFAWDVDSRADGKLAPNRLLVNSSSPYSFTTSSPQNDEQAVANDRDFSCCSDENRRHPPPRHVLLFDGLPFGSRAPGHQEFSGPNGAWWNWDVVPAPAIGFAGPISPNTQCARLMPRASQVCGHADFSDPVTALNVTVAWDAFPGVLYLEGYNGLNLVAQQSADLHAGGESTLALALAGNAALTGMTRVTLRVALDTGAIFMDPSLLFAVAGGYAVFAGIGVIEAAYVTVADARAYVNGEQNCANNANIGPPGSDASGKLAFLPNHDYEIVTTTSIDLGTASQASRRLTLGEALYFRTKGLPGLNACANVGDDIRLHVDTTYPIQRAIPLYRSEPCVLAFENSLSSVLPIDRTPGPTDPPEKAQMFPLELNIDRVVSQSGLQRLTMPTDDWIAAHRPLPRPPRVYTAVPGFATAKTRLGPSHDPLVQRFEAVKVAASAMCGAPNLDHASQVLLHEPIGADGSASPWEAATGYRATVRQAGGPFTEVTGFDWEDVAAFIPQADGSAAAKAWSADGNGNMVAPGTPGGRAYASCGDPSWDHLQVHTRVDLRNAAAAGIAVGVGAGTPVSQAIVATIETDGVGHALVVRAVSGSAESELGRASIDISGPALLSVIAFDDVVRATVGTVSVDGTRNAISEGRVALVADGVAAFAGIAVGALDIYSFEFITSKYGSFAEHIGSYDGSLPALAAGAFGGTPSPVAAVVAANAAAVPPLMQASADPQARQTLFDTMVNALGVGLRKAPLNVAVSRLTDGSGTLGFVLQSPEPVSLTRDVTLTLTQRVTKWIPPPLVPHPVGPKLTLTSVASGALAGISNAPAGGAGAVTSNLPPLNLTTLEFGSGTVTAPAGQSVGAPGDRLVRVVADGDTTQLQIFEAPTAPRRGGFGVGALLQTIPLAQAQKDPTLSVAASLTSGSIAVLPKQGGLGPVLQGHWVTIDVPVSILPISNGAETSILILTPSAAHLSPGTYHLSAVIDRDRWKASTLADPEQHYHDAQTLTFTW